MSVKTYYGLINDLAFPNVELVNYHYTRVLYPDSAMADDFITKFNGVKEQIRLSTDVEITAEAVGRWKAIVLIEGLGALYERNIESFEMIKNLIRRYSSTEPADGSVKDVLKVTGRRTQRAPAKKTPARTTQAPKPAPAPKKAPAKTAPTKTPATTKSDGTGDIDGITFADDIERGFTDIIVEEEVETCITMITRAVEQFSLSEEDAKTKLDVWAKKNVATKKLGYDPNYGNGEGLIRIV